MKCRYCGDEISGTNEVRKRAEFWEVDGRTLVFGAGMPDGNLREATGRLLYAVHGKHYWMQVKKAERAQA